MDQHNSTLDELLSDPITRQVMASDGVRIDEIRQLLQQARARMIETKCRVYATSTVSCSSVG